MEKLKTIQELGKLNEVYAIDRAINKASYTKYVIEAIREESQELGYNVAISFQNGPRDSANSSWGITDENLLEIVKHRLQCFQESPFACSENDIALKHIDCALNWMNTRVKDRLQRNVLGKDIK